MLGRTPQGWGTWGGASTAPPGTRGVCKRDTEPGSTTGPLRTSLLPTAMLKTKPPPFAVSSWQSLPQTPCNPQHASPAIRGSQTWRPIALRPLRPSQHHPFPAPCFCPSAAAQGSPRHPAPVDPAWVHPGAKVGQVRLEMLPEPRERRQPWPGNSVSFSPAAREQSGAVCLPVPACPRTPSPSARPAQLEKITFPLLGNPKQTRAHTAPLSAPSLRAQGGRQAELCARKHHVVPTDPHGRPHAHGPRAPGPKPGPKARPQRGAPKPIPNTWSCKGPPAKEPRVDAPGGTGDPQPRGHVPGTARLQVAQPDTTTGGRERVPGQDPAPSPAGDVEQAPGSS